MSTKAHATGTADLDGRAPVPNGTIAPPEVVYPEEDEERVGESDLHMIALAYLVSVLKQLFAAVHDVFVAGDMFLYYQEGNPVARIAPDIMVIRGVPNRPRPSFKLWEERQGPCFALEVLSPSSWPDDVESKPAIYARLGVPELFVFDSTGALLNPPLVRFRLTEGGEYARTDGTSLESAELDLRFAVEDGRIRVYDTATGEVCGDYGEERQAREAAEAEVARLRAELQRLTGAS